MNWQKEIQQRYAAKSSDAFRAAEHAFTEVLEQFLRELGVSIIDDNPEGQHWMILLDDGTELFVGRRSYDTGNLQTDFWIDYLPEHGGVVAEFFHAPRQLSKYRILVPNSKIVEVSDQLYNGS